MFHNEGVKLAGDMRNEFLLEEGIAFLNHGSFGATPRPVFAAYQELQRELELEPVRFIGRELNDRLEMARENLSVYLSCEASELVFVVNTTFGVNAVARSLDLEAGDEVVTSNHEYGACSFAWQHLCQRAGVRIVEVDVPGPFASAERIADLIWSNVSANTRVIFLSHIASPTALIFPVEELCAAARSRGIVTVIDGAHAPGQIDLDLTSVGADFYTGNLHKWLSAPKGSAFLYARRSAQPLLKPLVVSWGWGEKWFDNQLLDANQYLGTWDPSAFLSVEAAIEFQRRHNWSDVRSRCHRLLVDGIAEVEATLGVSSLYESDLQYHQMAAIELPESIEGKALQHHLFEKHLVEIPINKWRGSELLRISVQGYNGKSDLERLNAGVADFIRGGQRALPDWESGDNKTP